MDGLDQMWVGLQGRALTIHQTQTGLGSFFEWAFAHFPLKYLPLIIGLELLRHQQLINLVCILVLVYTVALGGVLDVPYVLLRQLLDHEVVSIIGELHDEYLQFVFVCNVNIHQIVLWLRYKDLSMVNIGLID